MSKYERFKLEWMIQHGFSLADLMGCMEEMLQEDLDGSGVHTDLKCLFADWEFGIGFPGGQIWPCEAEFKEHEDKERALRVRYLAMDIVGIFEDLLEEHGIKVPDDDRLGADDEAPIYGVTYGNLVDDVEKLLKAKQAEYGG